MQQQKPMKIWYLIKKKQKVVSDRLYIGQFEDAMGEGLTEVCQELDLERPVILLKHERELAQFNRAVFHKRDFIGDFQYDALEVECVAEKEKD